jgi:CubicO group peptidase (beta-lactamase class C family)
MYCLFLLLPDFCIALLATFIMTGCEMSYANPEHSQITNAGSSYLISAEELQKWIGEARDKYKVPAISVSLMDSNTIYRQEIQGRRVFNQPEQATLDDYFHIGSTAKSVLSVIAARLVEQGRLRWDTTFFSLYPELAETARAEYSDITLEDLLLSRAGLPAFTDVQKHKIPDYSGSLESQRQAFIRYVLQQPPEGKKKNGKFTHLYSNPGYVLASAMLERAVGLGYEEMVQQTLEHDLSTPVRSGWPNSYSHEQPWGHRIAGGKTEEFAPDHAYGIPEVLAPAGNLSMTPRGYARYTRLHLEGLQGKNNYISKDSWQRIHFGHKGFSLGVGNGSFRGTQFSGFDGSATTFFARSIIVPQADFAFTILTNAASPKGTSAAAEWLTQKIIAKQFQLNWWERFMLWLF